MLFQSLALVSVFHKTWARANVWRAISHTRKYTTESKIHRKCLFLRYRNPQTPVIRDDRSRIGPRMSVFECYPDEQKNIWPDTASTESAIEEHSWLFFRTLCNEKGSKNARRTNDSHGNLNNFPNQRPGRTFYRLQLNHRLILWPDCCMSCTHYLLADWKRERTARLGIFQKALYEWLH